MSSYFESFCTRELSKVRRNAMFLTVRDYENEFSEVSDFSIVFHVDYMNSIQRSKQIIEQYKPNFKDCEGRPFSIRDVDQARKELLDSYSMTLSGFNPLYTCIGAYEQVLDQDGQVIPGIKLHKKDDILHLEGYRVQKRVLRSGKYPVIKSYPLTLAKNMLRTRTPADRWGQFKLSRGRFSVITVDRINITHHDVLREAGVNYRNHCER